MNSFLINGKMIETSNRKKISVVKNHGLFDWDTLVGDYSYTIDFEVTPDTCAAFNFINIPESVETFKKEYNYIHYLNGNYFEEGIFVLKKASPKLFSGYLKSKLSALSAIKNTKLSEIDYGTPVDLRSVTQSVQIHYQGPSSPTNIGLYVSGVNFDVPFNTSLTQTLIDLAALINSVPVPGFPDLHFNCVFDIASTNFVFTADFLGIFPYLVVYWTIPSGAPGFWDFVTPNYDVEIGVLEEYATYLYSVTGADASYRSFAFFPVINTGAQTIPRQAPGTYLRINPWQLNDQAFEIGPAYADLTNPASPIQRFPLIVPYPFVSFIIDKIGLASKQRAAGQWMAIDELRNYLVLYNNYYLNTDAFYLEDIKVKNHVPDLTVEEFLNVLRKSFNLFISEATGKLFINNVDYIIEDETAIDLTHLISGDIELEDSGFTGFQLNWNWSDEAIVKAENDKLKNRIILEPVANFASLPAGVDNFSAICLVLDRNKFYYPVVNYPIGNITWSFYCENLQDVIVGDGSLEIKPDADTLLNTYNEYMRMPITSHEMNGARADAKSSPLQTRFLLYRGFEESLRTDLYQEYACSDGLNPRLTAAGNYSLLHWQGERGMHNTHWKKTTDFLLNCKKAKVKLMVDESHVLLFEKHHRENGFYQKVKLHNQFYIIDKMEMELPLTEPSTFTLRKSSWTPA